MWQLKEGKLFGIGKKTEEKLNELNIFTIKDLALSNIETLSTKFKNQSILMINAANGIDITPVISNKVEPKGIGTEITLEHNITYKEDLYKVLLQLSEKIGTRLRDENKYTSLITVVLKTNKLKRYSHQKKINVPINTNIEIYQISKNILDEMNIDEPIRLIGIRLNKLKDKKIEQVSIFDETIKKEENIDKIIDEINKKYGNIITKATLINK